MNDRGIGYQTSQHIQREQEESQETRRQDRGVDNPSPPVQPDHPWELTDEPPEEERQEAFRQKGRKER